MRSLMEAFFLCTVLIIKGVQESGRVLSRWENPAQAIPPRIPPRNPPQTDPNQAESTGDCPVAPPWPVGSGLWLRIAGGQRGLF